MKVGILGFFAYNTKHNGGQEHKTRTLSSVLKKRYGENYVVEVDTYNWKKKPVLLISKIQRDLVQCNIIIMLPAHNGVCIFTPIIWLLKKCFQKKIFYDVIGGWLPDFLKDKKILTKLLKQFDGIWVETSTMQNKLEMMGFTNVTVIPNFKNLQILSEKELVYVTEPPYKLCTFSRVMKEKGIEDAVNAVKSANEKLGFTAYTLDIYGQIDASQMAWFEELKSQLPESVCYCGCVVSDKSVEVLKDYYALLFPSYYDGEGLAGTLIDAFSAGVPIIASDWRYNADVVNEKTGVLFPAHDVEALADVLLEVFEHPKRILDKKINCLLEAQKYRAEICIAQIEKQLCL